MSRIHRVVFALSAVFGALSFSDTARAQSVTVSPQVLNFSGPPNIPNLAGCNSSSSCAVHVTGTNVGTVQVQIPQSSSWIKVTPPVLNIPNDLTVSVDTTGFPAGNFSGQFTVFSASNSSISQVVTVNLTVGASQLSATPTSLSFTGQAGDNFGTPQGCPIQNSQVSCQVTIQTTSPTPLTYNITTNPPFNDPHPWLRVDALSGTTNGSPVNVGVNPSATAGPGTYTGSILFQSTTTNDAVTVSVTLVIGNTPTITVSPTQLNFFYTTGGSIPAPQQIAVSSGSGSVSYNVTTTGASWLGISPISSATPTPVTVSVSPTSPVALTPGRYTATVTITPSSGAAQQVNVVLVVSNNPFLTIPTTQLNFSAPFGGAAAPQPQNVAIGSTGAALNFTATATSDQNWLTVVPNSGMTGTQTGTIAVGVSQSVLAALPLGTYNGTVTIAPSNGDPYTLTIAVTLTVGAASQITAAPQALFFSYQTGQAAPATQIVDLAAAGPPVTLSVSAVVAQGNPASCGTGSWLSAIPQQSPLSTPNRLAVNVNPAGMTAGLCIGTVKITYATNQGNQETDVPVTLFVSGTPLLNISLPEGFGSEQTTTPSNVQITRQISLTSTDGTTPLQYQVGFQSSPCNWLTATPITGGNTGTTPTPVSVNIQSACLTAPGTYQGGVTISSSALPQPVTLVITLVVTSNVQIAVTPQALSFTMAQNGAVPPSQKLNFSVSGGNANFIATATTDLGNWLKVEPGSGSTSAGSVTVSVVANTLPASSTAYTGKITLTFQNAATPSATIPVTLKVNPPQTVSVTPQSLAFTYQLNGSAPAAQPLNISSSGGAVNFSIGTTSTGGWLVSDTVNGQTDPGGLPKAVSISIDPAKIPTGTQAGAQLQGSVTVSAPSALSAPITIAVTLSIAAAPIPQPVTISTSAVSNGFGAVAPGELIAIKGTSLGPSSPVSFTVNAQGKLDSTLAGVQVTFNGTPGTPIFVSSTQINVIVPWEVASFPSVTMVVLYNGGQSAPFTLSIAAASPGIYTQNATGAGQAAAINLGGAAISPYNGPAGTFYPGTSLPLVPATPGSFIALFLTGCGLTTPLSVTGTVNPAAAEPLRGWTEGSSFVTATIGGAAAHVQYAGAAPTLVNGVCQINLQVPTGISGNNLPVTITVNGVPLIGGTPTVAVQ